MVSTKFQMPDLSNITCIDNIFEGKEFCVISQCEPMSKSDIEKKIHEYGGRVVQNPGKIKIINL